MCELTQGTWRLANKRHTFRSSNASR